MPVIVVTQINGEKLFINPTHVALVRPGGGQESILHMADGTTIRVLENTKQLIERLSL